MEVKVSSPKTDIYKSLKDACFGAFQFKDSLTSCMFNYRDSLEKVKKDDAQQNLTTDVFKFTKKFEMKCRRDRYLLPKSLKYNTTQSTGLEGKTDRTVRKYKDIKLNKENRKELQRILQDCSQHVSQVTLRKSITSRQPKTARNTLNNNGLSLAEEFGWSRDRRYLKEEENTADDVLDLQEWRMKETCLNRMTNRMKDNMDSLVKSSFNHRRKKLLMPKPKPSGLSFDVSNRQNVKQFLESLQFSSIGKSRSGEYDKQQNTVHTQFLQLVHKGYVNQVCLQLSNGNKYEQRDNKGNNIFHIAINNSDQRMIEMFLKVLHGNIAYSLLHSPNKLKKTPIDKINLFGLSSINATVHDFLAKYSKV